MPDRKRKKWNGDHQAKQKKQLFSWYEQNACAVTERLSRKRTALPMAAITKPRLTLYFCRPLNSHSLQADEDIFGD